jgi:hypothetical protein
MNIGHMAGKKSSHWADVIILGLRSGTINAIGQQIFTESFHLYQALLAGQ